MNKYFRFYIEMRRCIRFFYKLIVVAIVFFMFINVEIASAKTIRGTLNVSACKAGRYLYYGINGGGTRDGINRLDTKTGKIKEIIHNDITGTDWTNGFGNITVNGGYIYATWDQYAGSGGSKTYIYRITKDGNSMERLSCGCEMVVVGKRIYYNKCKLYDDGFDGITVNIGKASMKLDGTGKRTEKGNKFQWKSSLVYLYDIYRKDAIGKYKQGNYMYYTSSDGKKLIRKSKSGAKKVIYQAKGKYRVTEIEVYDNYILVSVNTKIKCQVYFIKNNGKGKKLLKKWILAE